MDAETSTKRSLVVAPFYSSKVSVNRPYLVSDVLSRIGTVDIVTINFDHYSKSSKCEVRQNNRQQIFCLPTIPYYNNVSFRRFLSNLSFSLQAWIFFLKRRKKYDIVYCSLPFNLSALLIFSCSRKKIRIADIVDIWPDALPFPAAVKTFLAPLFYLWKKTFIQAVRRADILLTVSDTFLEESLPYFRKPAAAAKRFYVGHESLISHDPKAAGPFTIAYVGNIGRLIDYETLLAALAQRKETTRFYLIGDGDRREWLLYELEKAEIAYEYFGIVTQAEHLAKILASCSIGFNGYRNTSATFSYKANTYFAAGLPILNSMAGDLERMVSELGLGFNYKEGDVASLLEGLDYLSGDSLQSTSEQVKLFFADNLDQKIIKKTMEIFIRKHADEQTVLP